MTIDFIIIPPTAPPKRMTAKLPIYVVVCPKRAIGTSRDGSMVITPLWVVGVTVGDELVMVRGEKNVGEKKNGVIGVDSRSNYLLKGGQKIGKRTR